MEDKILYDKISKNLERLFDIECPESKVRMMSDVDEILCEFKRWMDWWNSKDPQITNPNINPHSKINKLLFMKKHVCQMRILNFLKELERIGLHEEFKAKYYK